MNGPSGGRGGGGRGSTHSPKAGGLNASFNNSFGRTGGGGGPQGIAELANAAREQMQQLFGRPSGQPAAADTSTSPRAVAPTTSPRAGTAGGAAALSSPMTISPSNSLSEALQLDVEESPSLTFAGTGSLTGSAERSADNSASPRTIPSGNGGVSIPEGDDEGATSQMPFGSPAAQGPASTWNLPEPAHPAAAEGPERSSGSMVQGLRELLQKEDKLAQALAQRRAEMRKRTSAGLAAVEGLGPAATVSLLALAAAALACCRGAQLAAVLLWLLRDHAGDLVAATCLSIVLLKGLLAAHLDTRLRAFLEGLDDTQASVKAVLVMGEDVRTMRNIIETMQADMEAKTAWIPTGMKPPTWLPGQKRGG